MKFKKRPTYYQRMHGGRHRGRKREKFYDTARWQKVRKEALQTNPVCADPFGEHKHHGEVVAATEVDHIVPRSVDESLELVIENLQSLCHRCHSRKTRKEQDEDQPKG